MPALHDKIVGIADKPKISDPKVDEVLHEYVEVPEIAVSGSKWAVDIWDRLGRPNSPFSEAGERLLNALIAMWEELYPKQAKQWYADRAEYQKAELSASEQVHQHTGGSLASFPFPLFRMMKQFFPGFKVTGVKGRETCKKIIKKWPMFRMSKVR